MVLWGSVLDRNPATLWLAAGVAGKGRAEAALLGLEGAGLLFCGLQGARVCEA